MSPEVAAAKVAAVESRVQEVLQGKAQAVRWAVVAVLAARDVQKQRAARPGGVSADLVGAAAGKDGVSRCERAYTPAHSLDAHRDESTGAFERLAEVPRGRPMCPPRAPSIPSSRVSSR